jgi:hydrogenase nickel incorporation protein HypA/HybF
MHELSIAEALLGVCERELASHGGGRLETVLVAVGELSAVEPDLLRFAWDALVADSRHAGARLEVEVRRAVQTCPVCGEIAERAQGSWLRICPQCAGPLRVDGGDELDLIRLTLVEDPAGPR